MFKIPIKRQYQKFHQLNKEEKLLRSIIGKINWVATQTQPDISFDVLDFIISMNKNYTILDWLKAAQLLKKVKVNEGPVIYPHFSSISNPNIFLYLYFFHFSLIYAMEYLVLADIYFNRIIMKIVFFLGNRQGLNVLLKVVLLQNV